MTFAEDFAAYEARNGTPDRIELLLSDINSVLRGKWLRGTDARKLDDGLVRMPYSTYAPNILGEELPETGVGIDYGDPDGILVPVPGTLRPVPWADGHVVQVLVEMKDPDGRFGDLSARGALARMLERYQKRGLKPVVATELEFYIIQKRSSPDEPPVPPKNAPMAQNYELNVLDRTEAITSDIQEAAEAQNLDTDSLIAEYGPGQFEINFHHTDDVLNAADTAILFRRLVRGVTKRHKMRATFMAKPYREHPGNGMHVHASLVGKDGNIFSAEAGVGDNLKHAVAGVLATMPQMQAILAPHLNSYRRFAPGSFAPSRPDWGLDDRRVAVRLPETRGPGARLEHRIAGADVNPYLALTAILGGILYGLDQKPPLPVPFGEEGFVEPDRLTHDWRHALDRFEASEIARDLFGARFHEIYTIMKYDEAEKLSSLITPVEYRMYLDRL